jgi:hypothetical protein
MTQLKKQPYNNHMDFTTTQKNHKKKCQPSMDINVPPNILTNKQ